MEHTEEAEPRHLWSLSPLAGAGSSCLQRTARAWELCSPCWKEPGSQVLAMGCTALLARGGAGVGDDPPRVRLLPAEEPWLCKGQMKGWRATELSPARSLSPWCKLGLQNTPGCVRTCVALSKAVQMLQTPWSSHTNPSL